MKETFWLVPGRLAGRPGPNRVPWRIADLASGGFTRVISLTERMFGSAEQFWPYGIEHVCIPLPKSAPPRPGDALSVALLLPHIAALVDDHLQNPDHRVLVHCSSGGDRTGLFFAYYLMSQQGVSLHEALHRGRSLVPRFLTADGWLDLAVEVLTYLETAADR